MMKSRWIWVSLIFMGLVMSGLIFFQIYWFRSSVKIKEQQFDQLVNKTLSDVAIKIQKQEAVLQVINEINPAFFDTNLYRQGSSYFIDTVMSDNNIWIELQHDINGTDDHANQIAVNDYQASEYGIQPKHSPSEKVSKKYPTEPSGISQLFLQRERS